MEIYVRKYNTLKIVATSRPERNLLKHFIDKIPHIVGHSIGSRVKEDGKELETEVTLELRFKEDPGDPSKEDLPSNSLLKDGTPF